MLWYGVGLWGGGEGLQGVVVCDPCLWMVLRSVMWFCLARHGHHYQGEPCRAVLIVLARAWNLAEIA